MHSIASLMADRGVSKSLDPLHCLVGAAGVKINNSTVTYCVAFPM